MSTPALIDRTINPRRSILKEDLGRELIRPKTVCMTTCAAHGRGTVALQDNECCSGSFHSQRLPPAIGQNLEPPLATKLRGNKSYSNDHGQAGFADR